MSAQPEDLNPSLVKHHGQNRVDAAIALKIAGASFEEVARQLGYASGLEARKAVEAGLAATIDGEDKAVMRQVVSRRLDRLLRSVWPKAADPTHAENLPAVRTALAIIDRHARLHGLDAPTEVTVYTPAAAELEKWVAEVLRGQRAALPAEPDVLDDTIPGEVVDG